jgi:transcriptional regulator with XRE-family HTH domain
MDRKGVGSLRTAENDILIQLLREARAEAKVSQEELSRRMGQSITYIVKIERGTRRLDVVEFMRLAECLGLLPEELFTKFLSRVQDRRA